MRVLTRIKIAKGKLTYVVIRGAPTSYLSFGSMTRSRVSLCCSSLPSSGPKCNSSDYYHFRSKHPSLQLFKLYINNINLN